MSRCGTSPRPGPRCSRSRLPDRLGRPGLAASLSPCSQGSCLWTVLCLRDKRGWTWAPRGGRGCGPVRPSGSGQRCIGPRLGRSAGWLFVDPPLRVLLPQRLGRWLSPLPGCCLAPAGRGPPPRAGRRGHQQESMCGLRPRSRLATASAGPTVSRGPRAVERLRASPGLRLRRREPRSSCTCASGREYLPRVR